MTPHDKQGGFSPDESRDNITLQLPAFAARTNMAASNPSHYIGATQQSPQSATFPPADGDITDKPLDPNDQWSGDESLDDQGNRKRKRPMSVSCELCKQRKVKCLSALPASQTGSSHANTCTLQATGVSPRAGSYLYSRFNGRNLLTSSLQMVRQKWPDL